MSGSEEGSSIASNRAVARRVRSILASKYSNLCSLLLQPLLPDDAPHPRLALQHSNDSVTTRSADSHTNVEDLLDAVLWDVAALRAAGPPTPTPDQTMAAMPNAAADLGGPVTASEGESAGPVPTILETEPSSLQLSLAPPPPAQSASSTSPLSSSPRSSLNADQHIFIPTCAPVLDAICSCIPADATADFAMALLVLASAAGAIHELLVHATHIEVARAHIKSDAGALFRNSTVMVKIVIQYMLTIGHDYLLDLLEEPLTKILSQKSALEVDPNKGAELSANKTKQNMDRLIVLTTDVLQKLFDTEAPDQFVFLCQLISNEIQTTFPDQERVAVSGFLFLRFICPTLVSPETFFDLKKALPDYSKRNLLLVTKIIQNLANGTTFGAKESYLEPANEVLERSRDSVDKLVEKLTHPSKECGKTDFEFGTIASSVINDAVQTLHYHISANLESIVNLMKSKSQDITSLVECVKNLGQPLYPASAEELRDRMYKEIRNESGDSTATPKSEEDMETPSGSKRLLKSLRAVRSAEDAISTKKTVAKATASHSKLKRVAGGVKSGKGQLFLSSLEKEAEPEDPTPPKQKMAASNSWSPGEMKKAIPQHQYLLETGV